MMRREAKDFYDREYKSGAYAKRESKESHPFSEELTEIINNLSLQGKKCLEVGAGRGALQDVVDDYVAVDLSSSVEHCFHKPFFLGAATHLPFESGQFDVVWTYAVLEHIEEPEKALCEMLRVLKKGGILVLSAAWYCRPWAAEGYPVRPYSDFNLIGKFIKASIPIRNSIIFRSSYVFPRRAVNALIWLFYRLFKKKEFNLKFRHLKPNYNTFWMSDSDAVVSIDPYDVILWCLFKGCSCISHKVTKSFFIKTGTIVFKKRY